LARFVAEFRGRGKLGICAAALVGATLCRGMGAPTASQRRAQGRVGTVLNEKWHIDSLLGIGGMAAVYSASHRNGKRAAIKVLHRELGGDPTLVTRFSREGYLANKVGHPGVVSVLDDAIAEDGAPYLVMELLDGYSLEKHTQNTPMAIPSVLIVIDELLDVLAAAHASGIVHRDIKPANLFVTREGKLKVLDFGIARLTESTESGTTQTGAAIGTPAYMPPEQARGRWTEVDAKSDLWAAAATMLALAMGERPRRAETVQEELLLAMTQPMPAASVLCLTLPPAVAQVLDVALSFERKDRFPDARAMQLALRRAAISVGTPVGAEGNTLVDGVPNMDSARVVHPGIAAGPLPPGAATEVTPIGAAPVTVEMAEREREPAMASGRTLHRSNTPTGATFARGAFAGVAAGIVVLALIAGGQIALRQRRARLASPAPPAAVSLATGAASPPDPSLAAAAVSELPSATASALSEPEPAPPTSALALPASASSGRARGLRPAAPKAAASDTASLFDRRF
jgi:serine/threonine-protein kinase